MVVETDDVGLYARTAGTSQGQRVGLASNRRIVWADCAVSTNFTPQGIEGDTDAGSTWVRVRWKPQEHEQDRADSEPGEAQSAWMYRGYLEPLLHNGGVPRCVTLRSREPSASTGKGGFTKTGS